MVLGRGAVSYERGTSVPISNLAPVTNFLGGQGLCLKVEGSGQASGILGRRIRGETDVENAPNRTLPDPTPDLVSLSLSVFLSLSLSSRRAYRPRVPTTVDRTGERCDQAKINHAGSVLET